MCPLKTERSRQIWSAILVVLAVAMARGTLAAQDTNAAITPTTKTSLFDGKTLAGWTFESKDATKPAEAIWSVTNGVIFCEGKPPGYARTLKTYRDYQLHVEWRMPAGPGNSGVFLHLNPPDKVWPLCFEAQLLTGSTGELRLNGGARIARLADPKVIAIPRQKPDSEKPVGDWNSCDVTCRGNTITLRINGVLQNEITETSTNSGAIGLQAEGSPVEFRNIVLDKLP
jgi:Domain of Unknown Function (DUF1080)